MNVYPCWHLGARRQTSMKMLFVATSLVRTSHGGVRA